MQLEVSEEDVDSLEELAKKYNFLYIETACKVFRMHVSGQLVSRDPGVSLL
jgi:hypothetical protein